MGKIRGILVLAAVLVARICHGETPALDNWYQVEVIIFAQQDVFGEEARPLEPRLTYPSSARFLDAADQLHTPIPPGADREEVLAALLIPPRFLTREEALKPAAYAPLPEGLRNLNGEARAMARSAGYRVLFHSAWHQELHPASRSPWVVVGGGEAFAGHRELEGAIRVFRGRSLQAGFNLWLSEPAPPVNLEGADAPLPDMPTIALPPAPELPESWARRQVRLWALSSRAAISTPDEGMADAVPEAVLRPAGTVDILHRNEQLNLNSLTYVDHPRLGALVLVTPLAPQDGEGDSEEDGE